MCVCALRACGTTTRCTPQSVAADLTSRSTGDEMACADYTIREIVPRRPVSSVCQVKPRKEAVSKCRHVLYRRCVSIWRGAYPHAGRSVGTVAAFRFCQGSLMCFLITSRRRTSRVYNSNPQMIIRALSTQQHLQKARTLGVAPPPSSTSSSAATASPPHTFS